MSRRRVLIAAQKEEQTAHLSDLENGTGVKIGNSMFIIVSGSSARYLLRDALLNKRAFFTTITANVDYEGSNVDNYLVNTFIPAFSTKIRSYMVDANISCVVNNNGTESTKTIVRKAFLPSYSALNGNSWKTSLKTYYGVTNDNTASVSKYSGDAKTYWLRDAYTGSTERARSVSSSGALSYGKVNAQYYTRPCICMSNDTPVKEVNGVWTVV